MTGFYMEYNTLDWNDLNVSQYSTMLEYIEINGNITK